jgi:hypothetical protein
LNFNSILYYYIFVVIFNFQIGVRMKLGHIATGRDFYDRKAECADLWRYLENDHVVASGPRRLGKSSIVNRLREEAGQKGLLAAHVDVQGIDSAQAFIDEISGHFPDGSIKSYLSSASEQAKSWLSAVKKIEFKGPGGIGGGIELQAAATLPWHRSAMALQSRLHDAPVLIFVDEFSVFLQKLLERDQKEAEAFLGWLRAWRVTPGIACRFLFTGSIGLNALLGKYGLSAQFNDCFEYPIKPFSTKVACEMLITFAVRDGWLIDDMTAANICEKVGWLSPYYLCLLLDQTMQVARDRIEETSASPISPPQKTLILTDVMDAYERILSARSRFVHWEERLKRDLTGLNLNFAMVVLSALAKNPNGLTKRQLSARLAKLEPDPDLRTERLQNIHLKLEEEGYISTPDDTGRTRFLSFLLRDYWGRNHV